MENLKIIFIDKNKLLGETLEIALDQYFPDEFELIFYNNTTEAFADIEDMSIRREEILLLVCEQDMINLPGSEFLTLLSTLSPQSTKVLTSSYVKTCDYTELFANPSIDFILEKPFKINALINIICFSLQHYKASKKIEKYDKIARTLKNSLTTLRNKYQLSQKKILKVSGAINSFYWKLNLKTLALDIFSEQEQIFGYKKEIFTDFDSFLQIVKTEDQANFIETMRKLKVLLLEKETLYYRIINSEQQEIRVKTFCLAEAQDSETGAKSISGVTFNLTQEIEDFNKAFNLKK